jgi:hypothetical protein
VTSPTTPNGPPSSEKSSPLAAILSIIAIAAGLMAFAVGGIQGRRAGYEMMMMYSAPAVVAALVGIAIQRKKITYAGLVGGVLGVVGFILGS